MPEKQRYNTQKLCHNTQPLIPKQTKTMLKHPKTTKLSENDIKLPVLRYTLLGPKGGRLARFLLDKTLRGSVEAACKNIAACLTQECVSQRGSTHATPQLQNAESGNNEVSYLADPAKRNIGSCKLFSMPAHVDNPTN